MDFLNKIITPIYAAGADVVGVINPPHGIPTDYDKTNLFVSALIKMIMAVAGLFSLWQFLSGGFQYISSGGDKGKIAEATQKLTMSVTGLVLMTASFLIIAVVSKVLFNDATFILSPTLESVN